MKLVAVILLTVFAQIALAQSTGINGGGPNGGGSGGSSGGGGPSCSTINAQTGTSYTAVASDANICVTMTNAAANTFTIPPNSSVPYPLQTQLTVQQLGAGQTTVAPGAGVTIANPAGTSYNANGTSFGLGLQYGIVTFRQIAINTWAVNTYNTGTLLGNSPTTVCMASGANCPSIIGPQAAGNYFAMATAYTSSPVLGDSYHNYLGMNTTGDLLWETPNSHDQFTMKFDSSTSAPSGVYEENDVGDGPILAVDGSGDTFCGYPSVTNPITAGGCGILDTNGGNGASPASFLMIQDSAVIIGQWQQNLEKHWIGFSATPVVFENIASANTNDAQSTWGESTAATSTTKLAGPSIANTQLCNPSCAPLASTLRGTTGSIGGSALAAGACAAGTATVTGATTAMATAASPAADPDSTLTTGVAIYSFVSAANTVTVRLCAIVAVTPTATTYNVRVIQ